jgi:hypothetical protein
MRITSALLVLVLATVASPSSHAESISLLSHIADGPSVTVAASGNRAYLGHGGYLEILDVTVPSAPDLIGRHRIEGFIEHVELSGDLAFVCAYSRGIHILDISDPGNVMPVGFIPVAGILRNFEVRGSRLYSCQSESFHVFDVSDPASPVELGVYEYPNLNWVSVWDNHAYLGVSREHLLVVNIEDPTQPWLETLMPGAPYYTHVSDLLCTNGLMYVIRNWYYGFHNFRIYDLADPAQPAELSVLDGPLDLRRTAINHRWLHFTTSTGLTIFDASDPAAPVFLGSTTTLDRNNELALPGDLILAAQPDYGLRVFGTGELQSEVVDVVELGQFSEGFHGSITDVDLTANRLVTAGTAPGLVTYDVTDPVAPVLLGSMYDHAPGNPDTRCFEMEVQGNLAILRCSEDGVYTMRVIDIADPANPTELTAIPGGYMRTRFSGAVGFSRIGGVSDEIHVHDFADPGAPEFVTSIPVADWTTHAVSDDRLLVALAGDLAVFDVGDPQNPVERGRVDLQWSNSTMHGEITVVENIAYVSMCHTSLENEMRVVDFGDPDNPVAHTGPAPGDETWGIDSDDGYLYIAVGASGAEVFSLDNPLAPEFVGRHPAGYHSWNVNTGSGIFAVANSEAGIFVYRNNLVATGVDDRPTATPRVLQLTNHPNPFGLETRVSFTLPSSGHLTLAVYNAKGQRVRVLREGHLEAGPQSVDWDGRDTTGRLVPSGVYFVRLDGKGEKAIRKLVVVR